MKQREGAVDSQMKDAAGKVKAGDKDGAVAEYKAVLDQKCLFPKKAKEAQKQLKALGVADIATIGPAPIFERRQSAIIERTMKQGLIAEMNAKRSEEHTSELQSRQYLVCRLLLEKKNDSTRHRR